MTWFWPENKLRRGGPLFIQGRGNRLLELNGSMVGFKRKICQLNALNMVTGANTEHWSIHSFCMRDSYGTFPDSESEIIRFEIAKNARDICLVSDICVAVGRISKLANLFRRLLINMLAVSSQPGPCDNSPWNQRAATKLSQVPQDTPVNQWTLSSNSQNSRT